MMLSDNNSGGPIEPTGSTVTVNTAAVKLTEEEAIEFLSNHNLVTAYTLVDIKDFSMTANNVAQRLNISKSEAEGTIEILLNMGLLKRTSEPDKYETVHLVFDDSFISSSDIFGLFMKFSKVSLSKLTSKDIYGYRYEALSKQVIKKYQVDMEELIEKMANESVGYPDCEVHAVGYSFAKVTRLRKDK